MEKQQYVACLALVSSDKMPQLEEVHHIIPPYTRTPRTRTPHTSTPRTSTPRTSTPCTSTPRTSTPRTHTPHIHIPCTHTLPLATTSLPLATSSLPPKRYRQTRFIEHLEDEAQATSSLLPKHYRQSRFIEHLEDEAQLADPNEPPEPEDGAESQRRLEAGLGLRTTLFAGTVAHIAFTVLNAAQEFIQSKLINYLHFSNSSSSDPEQRKRGQKLIGYLGRPYVNSRISPFQEKSQLLTLLNLESADWALPHSSCPHCHHIPYFQVSRLSSPYLLHRRSSFQ